MTNTTHTIIAPATMRAELAALPNGYDWILPDTGPIDCDQVLIDTHTEYRPMIEAMRTDDARGLDPSQVSYEWGTDGETLFLHTVLGREARRADAC